MQIVDGPHDEHTLEYSVTLTSLSPGLTYTFTVGHFCFVTFSISKPGIILCHQCLATIGQQWRGEVQSMLNSFMEIFEYATYV